MVIISPIDIANGSSLEASVIYDDKSGLSTYWWCLFASPKIAQAMSLPCLVPPKGWLKNAKKTSSCRSIFRQLHWKCSHLPTLTAGCRHLSLFRGQLPPVAAARRDPETQRPGEEMRRPGGRDEQWWTVYIEFNKHLYIDIDIYIHT